LAHRVASEQAATPDTLGASQMSAEPGLPPIAFLGAGQMAEAFVRVMPNTPALVQTGMAVLAPGTRASTEHAATALRLFGALGRAIVLPERHLDAVTALSGSGPAFLAVVAATERSAELGRHASN
jgi:pyrroline-5-carboxylate reductase